MVNTAFERGAGNRIVVTHFDGNNDKNLLLPNADIFLHDIRKFGLLAWEDFLPVAIGRQNSDESLGPFNIRFDLNVFFSRTSGDIQGTVLILIVMKSGI